MRKLRGAQERWRRRRNRSGFTSRASGSREETSRCLGFSPGRPVGLQLQNCEIINYQTRVIGCTRSGSPPRPSPRPQSQACCTLALPARCLSAGNFFTRPCIPSRSLSQLRSAAPVYSPGSCRWAVCHVAVVYFNCKPCRGNRYVGPHVPSAILRLTGELGFCPFSQRWGRRICPVSSAAPCNSKTLRQELTHVSPLIASPRPGFLPLSSDAQGGRCR